MGPYLQSWQNLFEGFVIRALWVVHASRLRKMPDLCPPACTEGHTYRWPCRARVKNPVAHDRYLHYDEPIATDVKVEETSGGMVVTGKLNPKLCGATRAASYGSRQRICIYAKGHEADGIPHSWIIEPEPEETDGKEEGTTD